VSSIARAVLIPIDQVEAVAKAAVPKRSFFGGAKDEFEATLTRLGGTLAVFEYSGHVLATVLPYLLENGADLVHSEYEAVASAISSARGCSCFVLTREMRKQTSSTLDALDTDEEALAEYYEEFTESEEPDVGPAMVAGIAYLRTALDATKSDKVALLIIG
jgi:hypothetical protein